MSPSSFPCTAFIVFGFVVSWGVMVDVLVVLGASYGSDG
jgi:hypothetical protein